MKAITEFSGTIIRLAAKAASEARSTLPAQPAPVAAAEAPVETPAEAPVEAPAETPVEAPAEGQAEAADEAPAEAPVEPVAAAPVGDSDEVKAVLEEAIGKETNISGDRLKRLREALEAVGKDPSEVRLVRVFSAEEPLNGARQVGEHQFVIDLLPKSMKQNFSAPGKEGRGGRGGGRGMRGGAGERAEGPLDGGFSMDSLKNDRGGGGRGRGPGGGGRGGPRS